MKNTKKKAFYFLIIISILAIGFYRDFIFKKINALLQAWDHDMDYQMPDSLRFLENYEYDSLVNLKWILTFSFSILYLIISVLAIKLIFANKKYVWITVCAYTGVLVFASLFILIGYCFQQ